MGDFFEKNRIFLGIIIAAFIIGGFIYLSNKPWTQKPSPTPSSTLSSTLSSPSPPNPTNLKQIKTVTRVLDGDTIEIEGGEQVRYIGMNASESGEPCFREASIENEKLVLGKKVSLEYDVQTKDRYQRILAYVWVGDIMANLELVKRGYANVYTFPPNVKYDKLFVQAEKEAREAKRGCWSQNGPESCIKIVNINADAPGNDNENKNGEWIEIKNTCSESRVMDNWLLKDSSASNRYAFSNFTLNSGATVIIYSGCEKDSQNKLYWQCPEGKYAVWNNTGDHAFLYDINGNLVTDYQY